MEIVAWSFVLRFAQAAIEAALTLVIGAVVAGILRRMVGPAGTRHLFGTGWVGLLRGWVAGMLLPVCSLGVIPVARELRRAGVPGSTVLSFVLAAPLLNPISFLYGLTLAEPVVILSFAGMSLGLSTLAGWLWDRVFARRTEAAEAAVLARIADNEPAPPYGLKRLLAVAVTAARELAGRDLAFYMIGLTGSALLATVIPFGALQHTMSHRDPFAPVMMVGLAVPVFSSPLPGMMKIGLMFDHGNSLGAAFVLFTLGIGTSLGTLTWLGTDFGWRRVIPWFLTFAVVVVGMGYAAEPLLYDTRKEEIHHTHAFDDYSAPFPGGSVGLAAMTATKLGEKFGPLERPGVYALLALTLCGVAIRRFDHDGRLEHWLTAQPAADRPASRWDVIVPGPVLGAVALLGLVAFSVIGAYVFYPNREQCRSQMGMLYADTAIAVKLGHTDAAIRYLEQWDLLVRKLEVGEYIRSFRVTAGQSRSAADLREAIEEVRDALTAGDADAARRLFPEQVEPAYRACKEAFPLPPPMPGEHRPGD